MGLVAVTAPLWWLSLLDLLLTIAGSEVRLSPSNSITNAINPLNQALGSWVGFVGSAVGLVSLRDAGRLQRIHKKYPCSPIRQQVPLIIWMGWHYVFFLLVWLMGSLLPATWLNLLKTVEVWENTVSMVDTTAAPCELLLIMIGLILGFILASRRRTKLLMFAP
jgi:hypothetical protein